LFEGDLPEGLTVDNFDETVAAYYQAIRNIGGEVVVLKATTVIGNREPETLPVGVVGLRKFEDIAYPHAWWFEWATARNKIESSAHFLVDLKKENNVLIKSPSHRVPFYNHLGKYGILRTVGILKNHYAIGEHATLFEGVR